MYNGTRSDVVGLQLTRSSGRVLRAGYDLFREIAFLMTYGQPPENALTPTLDSHIALLRGWIVDAGIPVVEIPPAPYGHSFIACLTHDVDFAGIRHHRLDRTFWGFLYRALVGSVSDFLTGRGSLGRLIKNWISVLSLPLVYIGLVPDFWDQFQRYAEIEGDARSTFFLVPFKKRPGCKVQRKFAARRSTLYDIDDVRSQVEKLSGQGFEIGLHGIDAWHSLEKGAEEMHRISEATGEQHMGVRMHWLCFDRGAHAVLDQAGFDYDSTIGYNKAIGYKGGTTQVFQPLGAKHLLELPLHIQDTALFYALKSTRAQAWDLCSTIMDGATMHGGVVTVLWHQRSIAPERLWDDFYIHLLQELRDRGAWFGTARQVVEWFRQRRAITFEGSSTTAATLQLRVKYDGPRAEPYPFLRVHGLRKASSAGSRAEPDYVDVPWKGEPCVDIPIGRLETVR